MAVISFVPMTGHNGRAFYGLMGISIPHLGGVLTAFHAIGPFAFLEIPMGSLYEPSARDGVVE